MNRNRLSAMALIAAGAVLGYVAASSDFRLLRPATAANPPASPAVGEKRGVGCSEGGSASVLLAGAATSATSTSGGEAQDAGSAKKPNIVVIAEGRELQPRSRERTDPEGRPDAGGEVSRKSGN